MCRESWVRGFEGFRWCLLGHPSHGDDDGVSHGSNVWWCMQVGKLSMEWKVEENSKVAGTFPPMARTERKWTGYVEKDTAGQTNIYAVEVSYLFLLWHVEFEMVTFG